MRVDDARDPTVGAGVPAPGLSLPPGTQVGAYRIVELLGTGAVGRVYLAEHQQLGRKVALKLLRDEHIQNAAVLSRFFAEARAANRIHHENIVEVHDFVSEPGKPSYLIMELLRGRSLADLIDFDDVQPLERTVGIARQIASALSVVHAAGVVHRDLKPDNIFLAERPGRTDFVKLLDFGIAKLDADEIAVHQTAVGTILGTPEYMSPEQASGTLVDARTDVYALGVLLYEMTTGVRPFQADSFGEMVVQHLTVMPIPPSEVDGVPHVIPSDLEQLILDCLEKDKAKRPQSMDEIGARLAALEERLTAGRPAPPAVPRPRPATARITGERRRRPVAKSRAWLPAALLGAIAAAVVTTLFLRSPTATPPAAPAITIAPPPAPVAATPVPVPVPIVTEEPFPTAELGAAIVTGGAPEPPRVRRPSPGKTIDRNGVFDDPYAP
jgi:serine/threonine protein kinase